MRLLILVVCCSLAGSAMAQSASQAVKIVVVEVNEISVPGNVTLTINSGAAGSTPDDATSATSYRITTNGSDKKITGQLDAAYASGISLAVRLAAPTGASSQGQKRLSTTAQDLVTGISVAGEGGLEIAYTVSAETAVSSNGAGETKTVTLTITAGS